MDIDNIDPEKLRILVLRRILEGREEGVTKDITDEHLNCISKKHLQDSLLLNRSGKAEILSIYKDCKNIQELLRKRKARYVNSVIYKVENGHKF